MTRGSAPSPELVPPTTSPLRQLATKKLGLREVARRFELGEGFDEYREYNLLEENTVAGLLLQQTLAQLPTGHRLLAVLLGRAQDLRGRVVGRNHEDAERIVEGIRELQLQWSAHESSMKASLQEAQQAAKSAISAAVEVESEQRMGQSARITELETLLEAAQRETTAGAKPEGNCKAELQGLGDGKSFELGNLKKGAAAGTEVARLPSHRVQPLEPAVLEERIGAEWGHLPPPPDSAQALRIVGRREVGATLQVVTAAGVPPSMAAMQWLRQTGDGDAMEPIAGAVRCQYSPEPADARWCLACRCDMSADSSPVTLSAGRIGAPQGVEEEVAELAEQGGGSFAVVVVQVNGEVQRQKVVSTLDVSAAGIALLGSNGSLRCQTEYNPGMQVCGARGGGDGAAQGVFLAFAAGQAFMLACESSRQRNMCIMLIRHLAKGTGHALQGPPSS